MESRSAGERESPTANIALVGLLTALCVAILAAGFIFARSQRKLAESDVASHLSAIADLKAQQILAWRSERMADAVLLASEPVVAGPPIAQSQFRLQDWLEHFRKLNGYTEVGILDENGHALNVATEDASPEDPSLAPLVAAALKTGKPQVSDFHAVVDSVFLDFVAPLVPGRSAGRAVFLRVEASAFLYGLVQAWPTPSPTAECLLVRREGNRVRYLNELRHRKGGAGQFDLPMRSDLPAAMALDGKEGVHAGIDYRDFPVVAALRRIPGTPWALVAKVDAAEIYMPLHQRFLAIGLVVTLLLVALLATFGLFWYSQRSRHYKREHQADLARQAMAGRYAHLSRSINDVVLLLDENGRILESNDRAASTYGYSVEELSRMSIQDLLDASELPGCSERLRQLSGGSGVFESVHRRKDGSSLTVDISSRPVESEGRKLHQSIVRDITERKRSEEQLRRAVRAMRVLSASNQALVRSSDELSLIRSICGAAAAVGGYPLAWIGFAEDGPEKSVRVVDASGSGAAYVDSLNVTWGDDALGHGPVGTCIRTGQIAVVNDFGSNPDFEPWRERAAEYGYRAAISLPLTSDGGIIGALTIDALEPDAFLDDEVALLNELAGDLSYGIETHRRRMSQARTEEALLQSALEFRTLFDTAGDAIFIADLDGHFLEVNRAACQRLGYSRDQLLQMTLNDIDSPAFAPKQAMRLDRLIQSGELLLETVHIAKDGSELPVEVSSSIFEYRGASAALCVARDIRERKRLEATAQKRAAELEHAKTEAENASRAKSQFLANMSHEIRTPMNGILGMSGLLLDTPLIPEQIEYAETIRDSAEALLTVVNDVLDFSKIEAGRMLIERVPFDIVSRLAEVGDLLALQMGMKGIEYAFQAEVQHRWVRGDAGRIRQIVLNLLGNAFKFTDHGGVTLRISEAPAASGQEPTFTISVADTGIGIAELDLPLVFQTFTQLDSSTTKRHQGTGLGLAISQRLAELMNAKLTVSSELGKGSDFALAIPLSVESEAPAPEKPDERLHAKVCEKRRRVLLAEDNIVNQKIGVRLLEKCSCRVDLAGNGKEAVKMAVRFPYDMIFMDCGMPEMDGYEATRAIRAGESNGGRIPIVALTAHAIPGTREECLEAGMDDYVAKPVTLEALEKTLLRWSP